MTITNIDVKKWKLITYVAGLVFVIAFVGSAMYLYKKYFSFVPGENSEKQTHNDQKTECRDCVRRKIDGVYVEDTQSDICPVAVMIDNHSDARPQFGLAQANLVIEAEAEGSITRYLAVFAGHDDIKEIGPVRSARPYYAGWAGELNAVYTHCGGSPEALVQIKRDNIKDLNEFYNGGYFWRYKKKSAPHNVLTSSKLLASFKSDKEIAGCEYDGWLFKDDSPNSDISSTTISIDYMFPYNIKWEYDSKANSYIRYLGISKHTDNNGSQIIAKNVVLQKVKARVLDEALRLDIEYIGLGEASVCLDGKCVIGAWKKPTKNSRTKFYYENGEEVKFNAGQTWIEVITDGIKIEY